MHILLTAFDPFGHDSKNVSAELLEAIDLEEIQISKCLLETSFAKAHIKLKAAIETHSPELVLCMGQAASRAYMSFEKVAINLIDARIQDNDGAQPIDAPIRSGAPTAYFSNLPIKAMTRAMQETGMPAKLSYSAGTYVCNSTFFHLMDQIKEATPRIRGGFLHLPLHSTLDAQGHPLSLERQVKALTAALLVAKAVEDLKVSGGCED